MLVTPIKVLKLDDENIQNDKYSLNKQENYHYILNDKETPQLFYCEWINSYGKEILLDNSLRVKQSAILKLNYDPRINSKCIIEKMNGERFKINGEPDNIRQKNRKMELQVERYQ